MSTDKEKEEKFVLKKLDLGEIMDKIKLDSFLSGKSVFKDSIYVNVNLFCKCSCSSQLEKLKVVIIKPCT